MFALVQYQLQSFRVRRDANQLCHQDIVAHQNQPDAVVMAEPVDQSGVVGFDLLERGPAWDLRE